jgi:dihydroxycyclohexadiene carboxylate dehydrogenase
MRFTDKVVAITGAAQGIGRQTAEQAAAEGAALLLIDRSPYVHELAAAGPGRKSGAGAGG